ncbi:hypothetical protein ACFV1L_22120 [Kitasatospora sp. NPDC059646]|uniref:hypothetical protein n=1 Tax=Kitasatospora sp. NPDC059646 TaxID=3346893 RepID=UPI0036A7B81A
MVETLRGLVRALLGPQHRERGRVRRAAFRDGQRMAAEDIAAGCPWRRDEELAAAAWNDECLYLSASERLIGYRSTTVRHQAGDLAA